MNFLILFFASQCSLIKNDSRLPSHLNYKTDNPLLTESFSIDGIAKILQNVDPNKANGHDKISTRMLQLCGNSISYWSSSSNRLWKMVLFRVNGKKGM